MNFDREKFKTLLHYVVWQTSGYQGFGATKLYKVLWFSEARRWVLKGYPIAGETYIREEHGPVPKHGREIRSELVAERKISEHRAPYGNADIWRFKSLTLPDLLVLSREERGEVDYWIKHIHEDHTATSISEESHDYGWEIAEMGEELPFAAMLASRLRHPTDAEFAEAKRRARRLGLM